MTATPEQLHDLFKYCIDFARTMLDDSGEFYPFGAVLGNDGAVQAVGGYDGNEHPDPHDIYRLLSEAFLAQARSGEIQAAALGANVDIPTQFSPPHPDGVRVHLESDGFSCFVYVPYLHVRKGLLRKKRVTTLGEPIAVEIDPQIFKNVTNA